MFIEQFFKRKRAPAGGASASKKDEMAVEGAGEGN